MKLLILARTYHEAASFALDNGMDSGDWAFVDDMRHFSSCQGRPFVTLPNFHQRADDAAIEARVLAAGLVPLSKMFVGVE